MRREKEDCSFIVSRSERKGAADAKKNTLYPLLRYALRETMSQVWEEAYFKLSPVGGDTNRDRLPGLTKK